MERLISLLGLGVFVGIAYLLSSNRRAVRWRTVLWGLGLQILLGVLIIKWTWGFAAFSRVGELVKWLLAFSDAGAQFVFGAGFREHHFAFAVLPTIIFVSTIMSVLYHFGVVQRVVEGLSWVMTKTMRTSGAESLCGVVNIFVGQCEAALFIRPYLPTLTRSEMLAMITGGLATIAAGVMAVYIGFGVPVVHLLAASVMAAPGALVVSKLLVPEEEEPQTGERVRMQVERSTANPLDAAASGAASGVKLALNVAAMLIAFLALLALANGTLAWLGGWFGLPELSLEWVFARVFAPLAWLLGIGWEEAGGVGVLLGKKVALNEFIAFADLKLLLDNARSMAEGTAAADSLPVLSERAVVLSTYALCGFANIGSVGMQIGAIGPLTGGRQSEMARLGLRALVAGTLANLTSACIAGVLL